MSNKTAAATEFTIEEGSTNVYADLSYADAAESQRKSQLAAEIARAIKARRLTQQGAAELLGVWAAESEITVSPVPEPCSMALSLLGLAGLSWVVRRRSAR